MNDISMFTKRGPDTGALGAVPSSPAGAGTKAHGLNHAESVCTWGSALQFGFAGTVPPLLGSPTMSGRFKLFPFHWKFTPAWLELFTTNSGNPEMARSITSTSQPPAIALRAPFQSAPNALPLPHGSA